MLALNNISKLYGEKTVINNVSISFGPSEVIGLLGKNGAGKSTFLKIISGEIEPDSGFVTKNGEIIKYLPQELYFNNESVYEFLKSNVADESYLYKINPVLSIVGLDTIDLAHNCLNLSGGQKARLYLASFLLADIEPTILLLDEPTNNLDLIGLAWLEGFVSKFKGTVLLTSHDRLFLDKTVSKILEINDGQIKTYGGNYSFYKSQKQIEIQALKRRYDSQHKMITKVKENILEYKQIGLNGELKFTSRNPYEKKKAGKASKSAVVREKKLQRLLESEEFIKRPQIRKRYGVSIAGETPNGKLIVDVENCTKAFGNKRVFQNISFSVTGRDRVWVVGSNGSGKTTLLKMIIGELKPDSGNIKSGVNIKVGYFSQESTLDPERTGIDVLKSSGVNETIFYTEAAYLNLTENDLRSKIGKLSRGQVAKMELLKLILSGAQLLVLDEPTNHLEIDTREDIEDALARYKGAIIVASHDRYFIQSIGVNKTVEV